MKILAMLSGAVLLAAAAATSAAAAPRPAPLEGLTSLDRPITEIKKKWHGAKRHHGWNRGRHLGWYKNKHRWR